MTVLAATVAGCGGGGQGTTTGGHATTTSGRPTSTGGQATTKVPAGWSGNVEEGTLADWYAPSTAASGNYGGGEYDSGGGRTRPTDAVAHRGRWAMAMRLPHGAGGTRMFRWRELRAARTTRQTAWYLIPRRERLTGPASSRYWIVFEFKSRTTSGRDDPFWYVDLVNDRRGGLDARLSWGDQSGLPGPRRGERGFRTFGRVPVPVGRWFPITATLTQSKDFDGRIGVTVDGRRLAGLDGVRTGWPDCAFNRWCVEQHWAVTNYSDGLRPAPAVLYTDDASVRPLSAATDGRAP